MAVFALLLWAGSAVAQVANGFLVGTVTDSTGAVIAGASVTAKNKGTGAASTVTTDQDGRYVIQQLAPGEYEIAVEASGFAKTIQTTATVQVGSRSTYNLVLKPAGTEDVVTVTGEAGATIETTNTVVQGVVDNRQLADLPLSGRNFANVAILIPGSKPVEAFDPTKPRTGTISLAGSSGRDANISIDGGDNKDNVVGGAVQNYTTEGIQEFVVQTQNFLPDTGRSAGGVITIVTKSGTNELHGSFVFFERNDRTNKRAFNNPERNPITGESQDKQPFDRQNIAGSLGFPIIKDKFFFFGAAEYTRENISIVIDPNAVNELKALNTFAARGEIPGVSSVAALPLISTPFRDTQFQFRTDLKWSDKQLMAFRYGHQTNKLENDQIPNNADVTGGANQINELRSFLFSDTYTVNSNLVNVFTFQFNKFRNVIAPKSDAPALFFPNAVFGRNQNTPQTTVQNKFQFKEALSYVKGGHSFKFGVDYIYTPILGGAAQFVSTPEVDFLANPTEILAAGGRLGDLDDDGVPIYIAGGLIADGNPQVDQSIDQYSFYGQDSWRVNRKFTINYGIRYDADIGFYETKGGRDQSFNRGVIALQRIGVLPQGKDALPQNDRNNVSPRLGFAYDPKGDGKAVLRASYGIFYDQIFQNVQFFALQQTGEDVYTFLFFDGVDLGRDPLRGLPAQTGSLKELPPASSPRIIDPNISTPYTQQASINFQYEFAPSWVFDTNYIHILGLHQFMNEELSFRTAVLNPNFTVGGARGPRTLDAAFAAAGLGPFTRVRSANSVNRSRYDAFTIGVNKRYSGSGSFKTQFGAHYTLSRALVYGGAGGSQVNDFGTTFENPVDFFRPIDLGRSSSDARHRFVLNGLVDMPFDFQVSTIVQAEAARPFTVFDGNFDLNGDGRFADFARVDASGNFIRFKNGDRPSIGIPLGPGSAKGVPYFQVDLRLTKRIKIGERAKVEGYVEFFNLLDRANIGNSFNGDISQTFPDGSSPRRVKDLQPTGLLGSAFGAGTTIGVPFQAQFGVRISF
jgi:hypothetical protein